MKTDVLFRFKPVFRHYLWGGRRLSSQLNKQVDATDPVAESWEIVDHHTEQSVIEGGPFDGSTINKLLQIDGPGILGEKVYGQVNNPNVPANLRGRFPLLFKFLDCNRDLSVQVHPDDTMGATLDPPDLGKTEAWYIIDTKPGSLVYAGLKQNVDKQTFKQSIDEGQAEQCLHRFAAKPGDCVMIPAGTVHALGEGLLVAEIQQASDTTFRLYDWNRVGADGNPRDLHVEQGLAASDFNRGPVNPIRSGNGQSRTNELVHSDKFTMIKRKIENPHTVELGECFRLIVMLDGHASIKTENSEETLASYQLMLVPASCREVHIIPDRPSEMLEIWI